MKLPNDASSTAYAMQRHVIRLIKVLLLITLPHVWETMWTAAGTLKELCHYTSIFGGMAKLDCCFFKIL